MSIQLLRNSLASGYYNIFYKTHTSILNILPFILKSLAILSPCFLFIVSIIKFLHTLKSKIINITLHIFSCFTSRERSGSFPLAHYPVWIYNCLVRWAEFNFNNFLACLHQHRVLDKNYNNMICCFPPANNNGKNTLIICTIKSFIFINLFNYHNLCFIDKENEAVKQCKKLTDQVT